MASDNLEYFKDRLRSKRRSKDLTQLQLADSVGVTQSTVANWERGRNLPEGPALTAISDLLEVDSDWLVGSGPQKPTTSHSVSLEREALDRLRSAANFLGRDMEELASELITEGLDRLRKQTISENKEKRKRLQIIINDEVETVEMGGVSIKKSDLEAAFEFAEKQAGIHGNIPDSK